MGFADWKQYINYKFGNGNLRCYYRISVSSLQILWYFHCHNSSIVAENMLLWDYTAPSTWVKDKGNIFSELNKPPFHTKIGESGDRQPYILNHYTTSLRVNGLIYIMIINNNEKKGKFLCASDICFHLVTNLFCGTFQTVWSIKNWTQSEEKTQRSRTWTCCFPPTGKQIILWWQFSIQMPCVATWHSSKLQLEPVKFYNWALGKKFLRASCACYNFNFEIYR